MTEKTFIQEDNREIVVKDVPQKILVVDDDPDIRTMIRIMLEYKGYTVLTLERGENSEEMLMAGNFGLVIMDMLLSGVNGVDICSHIKHNNALSHIPIVMISAHPNAKDLCLEAGADDFIAKPFDMQEMLAMIEKFMPLHRN